MKKRANMYVGLFGIIVILVGIYLYLNPGMNPINIPGIGGNEQCKRSFDMMDNEYTASQCFGTIIECNAGRNSKDFTVSTCCDYKEDSSFPQFIGEDQGTWCYFYR